MTSEKRIAKNLGKVANLAEFIGAINGELNGDICTLYRGQSDATWALKPAVARAERNVSRFEETSMLEEFKRRAIPYLDSPRSDLSDADWLAIAQHHGAHPHVGLVGQRAHCTMVRDKKAR
ncbi:FRG domain-containing protein [Burkholderia pseudomultivorans]|nr:FRG domain-containing protein [Burkholderia pseudomultivorans]MDS0862216.1 FRG domain-containing protein [Burkholderia pseudomultivorans]